FRGRAAALRCRRPAAALPRRALAALPAPLPDGARDAPPPGPTPVRRPPVRAPARPLPAGRTARRAGPRRLDAGRVPLAPARDARRARRLRRAVPSLRRGHRALLPGREGGLGALVCATVRGHPSLCRRDRPEATDPPN